MPRVWTTAPMIRATRAVASPTQPRVVSAALFMTIMTPMPASKPPRTPVWITLR